MGGQDVSNMPENTAFKQQRLPAWQPVLTAKNVLPTFVLVGCIFIPLGVILLITSNNCFEEITNYTDCISNENSALTCHEYFTDKLINSDEQFPECTCDVDVKISRTVKGPVYFYYRLTNFYQNHRIYVKSRDNAQLTGKVVSEPNRDCAPYQYDSDNKPISPCGTIANSLFNDTFSFSCDSGDCKSSSQGAEKIDRSQMHQFYKIKKLVFLKDDKFLHFLYISFCHPLTFCKTGHIAWSTDHDTKFNNPQGDCASDYDVNSDQNSNLTCAFSETTYAKPPFWKYPASEVYKITNEDKNVIPTNDENGFKSQALEVWMRTAAFPTFRKLYGKKEDDLIAGNYTLRINYNYPVKGFDGTKSFVVAQMTWAGGKNPFLGIAYIVVGSMSLCSAVALFFVHRTHQRRQR